MDRVTLSKIGSELLVAVDKVSNEYHVKSSTHEILCWESVGITNMNKELKSDSDLTYDLTGSALLIEWGKELHTEQSELAERVESFRKQYTELKGI